MFQLAVVLFSCKSWFINIASKVVADLVCIYIEILHFCKRRNYANASTLLKYCEANEQILRTVATTRYTVNCNYTIISFKIRNEGSQQTVRMQLHFLKVVNLQLHFLT